VFNRRDFLKKIGKFLTPHTSPSQVDKAATDRRQKQGQVKVNKAQSILPEMTEAAKRRFGGGGERDLEI